MLKGKIEKKVVFYICLTALLVLGIKYFDQIVAGISNLWNVMFPLVFGLVIAYVLNIVLVRVERLYFPRSKSRWVVATRRAVSYTHLDVYKRQRLSSLCGVKSCSC